MGFADSGTSVSIANPADLAAAIGADPSGQAARLVDNKPVSYTSSASLQALSTPADVPIVVLADVSAAVCVTVNASSMLAPTGSLPPATGPLAFDLRFDWYDSSGTVILWSELYEMNCNAHASVGQSIVTQWQGTVPCRGAKLSVTATNPVGTWANATGSGITLKVVTSSRVVPTAIRGYTDQASFDGLVIDKASGTLAISGSTFVIGAPCRGDVFLAFLGASTQMRFDIGWGSAQHGLLRDVRTWAAINNPSGLFGPFPATNRPLNVQIVNISTTATCSYNVSAWTAGNGG